MFLIFQLQQQQTFVDNNPAFQDLSESFRILYKSVFENSQGNYHVPLSTVDCDCYDEYLNDYK